MATTNKDLNLPAYNQTVPTWDQPLNANFTIIDNALGSSTSTINMAPGNYTLSTAEIQNMRIVVGGTLLTNRELIFPAGVGGNWIISNGSTGNFAITAKVSGGSLSITLPQGKHLTVFSSGTELYQADDGLVSLTPTFNSVTIAPVATDNMLLIGNDILTPAANAVAGLRVNYSGFNQGTTQFRNFTVFDGKNNPLLTVTGSTATVGITGTLALTGALTTSLGATISGKLVAQGGTATLGNLFNNISETATVSATAATGTINYNVTTQSVLYYTSSAAANFTINVRGNGTNTLNSMLGVGEAITVVFMNTNGATAYYMTALQVDGVSVTPKWVNGVAPGAGNPNSIDVYSFTIVKTASATYTALGSLTKFA